MNLRINLNKLYHTFPKPSRWVLVFATTALFAALVSFASSAQADVIGERHNFFVDKSYDALGRTTVPATLIAVGQYSHVYIEDAVIERYGGINSQSLQSAVSKVVSEFDSIIYPENTNFWGPEPRPGIDGDLHITILFEQLNRGTGGYLDTSNFRPGSAPANSNQREMISVSSTALSSSRSLAFLAHEMEHLISANQKVILQNVSEDTWLDELRAQFSVTLTGYNFPFAGSDLQSRKRDFLENPSDSLTEWLGQTDDYAVVTLFGQYLAGRYGSTVLKETMSSKLTGVDSINEWLALNGYAERFIDVFGDWGVANYLNESNNLRFGYSNPDLADVRVSPMDNQILTYPISLYGLSLKPWQSKWYRFIPSLSAADDNMRFTWTQSDVSMMHIDSGNNVQRISSGQIVKASGPFTLIPFYHPSGSSASTSEPVVPVSLTIEYTPEVPAAPPATVSDGDLIKRQGESDIYVVEGKYKRYLSPSVIALYGHLNPSKAIELEPARFDSYISTNYVRYINEQKVYAVWPNGTKHWLHMSAKVFSDSGRDWNSIFVINESESNFYKVGAEITK